MQRERLTMKLCLKYSQSGGSHFKDAAASGFTCAEIGLLDAQQSLCRGGSLLSLLSPVKAAGLACALQIPLPIPRGFGSGMSAPGIADPEDLLELSTMLCTATGASLVVADPFSMGPGDPLISDDMAREDLRLSLLRLIASHPYLRPCLRPAAVEGCAVRTLKEAALVLESLNRHEASLACDLALLGDEAIDELKALPRGMVKVVRLGADAASNRAAIEALGGSGAVVCATPSEAAALGAGGSLD